MGPPDTVGRPGWHESLAWGAPGQMLLHIEYARLGRAGWDTVDRWARAVTSAPVSAHPDVVGLYHGAVAVAYALRTADQARYAPALRTLDEHITELTQTRLTRARARIDSGAPALVREYDLINGLTGLGVYLLHRGQERHRALLDAVITYLTSLAAPEHHSDHRAGQRPPWWAAHGPADRPSARWPGGHANLGLAHGLAGPLALLAVTARRGLLVDGHLDAIRQLADLFDQWRSGSPARPWWPGLVSAREWAHGALDNPEPQRPSWCYGTPGIARALHLAAHALDDPVLADRAETALADGLHPDPDRDRDLDATLCHGHPGRDHVLRRARDDAVPHGPLTPRHDRDCRDHPHRSNHDHRPGRVDHRGEEHRPPSTPAAGSGTHDGLLEGAAGIALTTLPQTSHPHRWDACLLITS